MQEADYEYKDIIFEKHKRKKHVAWIWINRPQTLNALTDVTFQEIAAALDDCAVDDSIGVVVLTGVGDRAFSSGGDVKWERKSLSPRRFDVSSAWGDVWSALIHCPKPVIARINGYAIASGNHIAYHCDFSIAAEHAIFGQTAPRVGSPAEGPLVSRLAHIVGHKRAREMWYLCRHYTAQQAYEWGLVNAVVPYEKLDEEVDKWCDELLDKSPSVLRILKASFEKEFDTYWSAPRAVTRTVAPGFFSTGEFTEGMNAFLEKRKVDWNRYRK